MASPLHVVAPTRGASTSEGTGDSDAAAHIALNVNSTTFVARYKSVPTASPKLTLPRCCSSFMRYNNNTLDDVLIGFLELDVLNKSMLCAPVGVGGFVVAP